MNCLKSMSWGKHPSGFSVTWKPWKKSKVQHQVARITLNFRTLAYLFGVTLKPLQCIFNTASSNNARAQLYVALFL